MKFTDRLGEMSACSDAIKWVGKRGLKTAWRDCGRADWMLWLAGRLDIDRKLLVLAACDCAETTLQHVAKGENRPARAIQTARDWCAGTATKTECRAAAYAAGAAGARKMCADLVRQRIPCEVIARANGASPGQASTAAYAEWDL